MFTQTVSSVHTNSIQCSHKQHSPDFLVCLQVMPPEHLSECSSPNMSTHCSHFLTSSSHFLTSSFTYTGNFTGAHARVLSPTPGAARLLPRSHQLPPTCRVGHSPHGALQVRGSRELGLQGFRSDGLGFSRHWLPPTCRVGDRPHGALQLCAGFQGLGFKGFRVLLP